MLPAARQSAHKVPFEIVVGHDRAAGTYSQYFFSARLYEV